MSYAWFQRELLSRAISKFIRHRNWGNHIWFSSEITFFVITRMLIAQNLHAFFVVPGWFSSWITNHLHLAIKIFLLASNTMTAKHSMIFLTSATQTTSFHSDASVIFFSISLTASLKPWLYACSLFPSNDVPQHLSLSIFCTFPNNLIRAVQLMTMLNCPETTK